MTTKGPRGVVSPWGKRDADRPAAPVPGWKTESDDDTAIQHDRVRFPGRMRAVNVYPLHGKEDPETSALISLGKAMGEILATIPESRPVFTKQSLGFVKPTSPHITLDLGGVPFYAGTVTAEADTARRMAVDRIAHALTECSARFPKAKTLLAKYRVEVSNT